MRAKLTCSQSARAQSGKLEGWGGGAGAGAHRDSARVRETRRDTHREMRLFVKLLKSVLFSRSSSTLRGRAYSNLFTTVFCLSNCPLLAAVYSLSLFLSRTSSSSWLCTRPRLHFPSIQNPPRKETSILVPHPRYKLRLVHLTAGTKKKERGRNRAVQSLNSLTPSALASQGPCIPRKGN